MRHVGVYVKRMCGSIFGKLYWRWGIVLVFIGVFLSGNFGCVRVDNSAELTTTTRVPVTTPVSGSADAHVEMVRAVQANDGLWTFHVTVRHPDTGWDDYADGWDIVLPDGSVLKRNEDDPFTRLLTHPHETEQPFTRSQSGLLIVQDVMRVTVRAHDSVDGFGGREVVVDLTQPAGNGFVVQR